MGFANFVLLPIRTYNISLRMLTLVKELKAGIGFRFLMALFLIYISISDKADAASLELNHQEGKIGENVIYTLTINDAPNDVGSFGIEISYNPGVLEFKGWDKAGTLINGFTFTDMTSQTTGLIIFGGFDIGVNKIPEGATGTIAKIAFTVIGKGDDSLNLSEPKDDISSWSVENGSFTYINNAPLADAGADQTVDEGATVTLDGSSSTDPDDGIAAYQWTQLSGPSVILTDPTAVQTTFIAPDVDPGETVLTFQLTVTDSCGSQTADTCSVNVEWNDPLPTCQIKLNEGWNLIALCNDPDNSFIEILLNDIYDSILSVWKWEDNNWSVHLAQENNGAVYAIDKGFDQLETIQFGEGFWINSEIPQTLTISGTQPEDTSLLLSPGWNLVGLKSFTPKSIDDLIFENENNILSVWKWENNNWAVYLPQEGLDGTEVYAEVKGYLILNIINPGEGFWVNRMKEIILQ